MAGNKDVLIPEIKNNRWHGTVSEQLLKVLKRFLDEEIVTPNTCSMVHMF